jgi:hypothetical protein
MGDCQKPTIKKHTPHNELPNNYVLNTRYDSDQHDHAYRNCFGDFGVHRTQKIQRKAA